MPEDWLDVVVSTLTDLMGCRAEVAAFKLTVLLECTRNTLVGGNSWRLLLRDYFPSEEDAADMMLIRETIAELMPSTYNIPRTDPRALKSMYADLLILLEDDQPESTSNRS